MIRDRFKERNLIERLDRSFLEREGSVWASEREDAIYDVMYHLLPELEKLADIYMPNAVKAMMPTYPVPPKVRADLGRGLDWLEISFEMEGVDEQELQELMRSIVERKLSSACEAVSFCHLKMMARAASLTWLTRSDWKQRISRAAISGCPL